MLSLTQSPNLPRTSNKQKNRRPVEKRGGFFYGAAESFVLKKPLWYYAVAKNKQILPRGFPVALVTTDDVILIIPLGESICKYFIFGGFLHGTA
jgi:hypothetical protein